MGHRLTFIVCRRYGGYAGVACSLEWLLLIFGVHLTGVRATGVLREVFRPNSRAGRGGWGPHGVAAVVSELLETAVACRRARNFGRAAQPTLLSAAPSPLPPSLQASRPGYRVL